MRHDKRNLPGLVNEILSNPSAKGDPLLYAIVHDLVHSHVFGSVPDRSPAYGQVLASGHVRSSPALSPQLIKEKKDAYHVVFLCQSSLRKNYIFPMLHALEHDRDLKYYSAVSIELIYWNEAIPDSYLAAIKSRVQEQLRMDVDISVTAFAEIAREWRLTDDYIDELFEEVEKVVGLDQEQEFTEETIQESVEALSAAQHGFRQHFQSKVVHAVYTTNDQWFPMSAAFAAAVRCGFKTVLAYHGTIPEFALHSYADTIMIYTRSPDRGYGFGAENDNVLALSSPLDDYVFRVCHPGREYVDVLRESTPGRGSTIGVVAALSGDRTYGIDDYTDSFVGALSAIGAFRRKYGFSESFRVNVLPHPSDKKEAFHAVYERLLAESEVEEDRISVRYGMDFLEFAKRCGPIIGCPSTAFDSLIYHGYPIRMLASDRLLDVVFGYNPYSGLDVICTDESALVGFLHRCLGA